MDTDRLKRAARRAARDRAMKAAGTRFDAPAADDEPLEDELPVADVAPEPLVPEPAVAIAEEEPAPPRALAPTADYFRQKLGSEEVRSVEDEAADAFSLDPDEDFIPTPVMVRMQAFAGHYLATMNAADAARRAGYPAHVAKQTAQRLLAHPMVRSLIREQHRSLMAKIGVTQERIWAEIARIAFLDPAECWDENGELRNIHQIPEDVRRAISGIKVVVKEFGEDGSSVEKEVKFASKADALDKLMRLNKMVADEKVSAKDVADAMIDGLRMARQRAIEQADRADS